MSMSGITVDDEVLEVYKDFKLQRGTKKWIIARINKKLSSVVLVESPEIEGEKDLDKILEDFVVRMKEEVSGCNDNEHKCAFGVVKASTSNGIKVTLVLYTDDDCATTKHKMVYSTMENPLKASLEGIQQCHSIHDLDDLTVKELKKVGK